MRHGGAEGQPGCGINDRSSFAADLCIDIAMRHRISLWLGVVRDWWASYSGFVILPFGAIAFCVTVYEMLHGVM